MDSNAVGAIGWSLWKTVLPTGLSVFDEHSRTAVPVFPMIATATCLRKPADEVGGKIQPADHVREKLTDSGTLNMMMSRRIEICICVCLIALTVAAYWPVWHCGFVNFDDDSYVRENPTVLAGLTPAGIYYAFTTSYLCNWTPATWLSYLVDATFFGNRPAGYHAVNVMWHAANVCLLFVVLRRLTGALACSVIVAALFAVHPLHVESVAWISERKDVLSTFWLLVTLLAYERYAEESSIGWYAAVCVSFAVGLMSKSMLVTLPVLLWLIDVWPLERWAPLQAVPGRYPPQPVRRLLVEKAPLLLIALADGVITLLLQQKAMVRSDELPWYFRVGNAVRATGWYLEKTFLPTDLCILYPHPMRDLAWWDVGLAGIVLAAISFSVVVAAKRYRFAATGWCWFLISLLPVIGLVQVGLQSQADRYTYVPHIGLFVGLVWSVAALCAGRPWLERAGLATAIAAVVAGFVLTQRQVEVWRDSKTLWQQAYRLSPDHFFTNLMLGLAFSRSGEFAEAERYLNRSLELHPNFLTTLIGFGGLYQAQQDWDRAEEYFQWANRINPQDPRPPRLLAELAAQAGGRRSQRRQASAPPDEAKAQLRLGLVRARQGDMPSALRYFEAALEIAPEYADAHNNAGLALVELKRPEEAEAHYRQAVNSDSENPDFHVNLAGLLVDQKQWDAAREHYELALKLKPQDVEVKFRLESLTKRQGQE